MAAVGRSGRVLRISQTLRVLKTHRSYHKKQKGRMKDKKHREIDLNELLGGNSSQTTARAADIPAAPLKSAPQETVKTNVESNSWQDSQERLGLLRKGEKRVAVIAVITMILAFGAMKFMLHGMPKKELQETEGS